MSPNPGVRVFPARKRLACERLLWGALAIAAWSGIAAGQPLPPAPAPVAPPPPPVVEAPRNVPAGAAQARTPDAVLFLIENTADRADRTRRKVVFREEATSPDYFKANGGGSIRGVIDVDCDAGRFQLESFALYTKNNLQGEVVTSFERRTDWRSPGRATVLGRVIALACGRTAAPTAAAAGLRPGPSPAPAARPAPAKPADPRPPSPPAGGKGIWVQVGASPVEADAQGLIDRLRKAEPQLLQGVGQGLAPAQVRGAAVFRSLLGPLPDRKSAAELCRQLEGRRHPCFVRAE